LGNHLVQDVLQELVDRLAGQLVRVLGVIDILDLRDRGGDLGCDIVAGRNLDRVPVFGGYQVAGIVFDVGIDGVGDGRAPSVKFVRV
jgi:hypothetical protein